MNAITTLIAKPYSVLLFEYWNEVITVIYAWLAPSFTKCMGASKAVIPLAGLGHLH